MLATSVDGVIIFNVSDGSRAAAMTVPGNRKVQVRLAFGDRQFFLLYMDKKISTIRVYDVNQVLAAGTQASENTPKPSKEISPTN